MYKKSKYIICKYVQTLPKERQSMNLERESSRFLNVKDMSPLKSLLGKVTFDEYVMHWKGSGKVIRHTHFQNSNGSFQN